MILKGTFEVSFGVIAFLKSFPIFLKTEKASVRKKEKTNDSSATRSKSTIKKAVYQD